MSIGHHQSVRRFYEGAHVSATNVGPTDPDRKDAARSPTENFAGPRLRSTALIADFAGMLHSRNNSEKAVPKFLWVYLLQAAGIPLGSLSHVLRDGS